MHPFLVSRSQAPLGNALAGEAPASRLPEAGASGADAFPSWGLGTRKKSWGFGTRKKSRAWERGKMQACVKLTLRLREQ